MKEGYCPVCGSRCNTIYCDAGRFGVAVGCDECVSELDADADADANPADCGLEDEDE